MNLKHGFDSTSKFLNPDMQLLQRTGKPLFVSTITHLLRTPSATVGALYNIRQVGATKEESSQPLHIYFDRLSLSTKHMDGVTTLERNLMNYFCDAVWYIAKLDIPTNTPLNQIDYEANEPCEDKRLLGQAMRAARATLMEMNK